MSNTDTKKTATLLPKSPVPFDGIEETRTNEDDFDPHNFGKQDGINSFGATVHILRGSIGSGFLLMPYTIRNLGYVTGTLLLLSVAIVYYHIVHVIVVTEYRICKQLKIKHLSYIELADEVFKQSSFPVNQFRHIIRYCLYFLFGFPTAHASFLVLIANGIQLLGKFFGLELKSTYVISVAVIPLTLFCMSRKILEILVPYSNLTNFCSFLMAFIVMATSISHRTHSVALTPFGSITHIPESVAIYAKTFRYTALVLPIKHHMRHPEKYTNTFGPMNVAAFIITLLYFSFGIILYVIYGEDIQENVLFNMPAQSYVTDAINLLYTLTLFVTYLLVFYGRIDNLWSGIVKRKFQNKSYKSLVENSVYIGFNAVAYLLAVAVPHFAIMAAVSGTIAIPLELVLPLVMELLVRSKDRPKNYWIICKDVCIISVGVGLSFLSAKILIKQIINLY